MTAEDDARRVCRPRDHAPEDFTALAASASASCSLSFVDIPAIVRRRARARDVDPESSGIVDIDELCGGTGLRSALGMPTIPTTSLVPIAADPLPARPADSERRLLWAATATAGLAVAAMFAVVVTREPAPVILRAAPAAAPVMAAAHDGGSDREHEPDSTGSAHAASPRSGETPDEEPVIEITDEVIAAPPAAAPRASAPPKPPRAKAPVATKPPPTAKAPAATAPVATPPRASSADASVECVLDPASCGLGGAPSSRPAAAPTAPKTTLPEKLGTTALRTALGPAKAAAQACGPRLGVAKGTQVQVKLSIEGATGRVRSATATGAYAGTALGRCVAEALAEPVFPRFSATQQGVVYPIRL